MTASSPQRLQAPISGGGRLLFAGVVLGCNIAITCAFVARTNLILRLQYQKKVVLPVAKDRRSRDAAARIFTVFLADDGHLEVAGKPIDETQMRMMIAEQREIRVKILASHGARYDRLKALFATLGKMGVQQIIFSTLDSTPEPSLHAISGEKGNGP